MEKKEEIPVRGGGGGGNAPKLNRWHWWVSWRT